jgi:hypothetical protein
LAWTRLGLTRRIPTGTKERKRRGREEDRITGWTGGTGEEGREGEEKRRIGNMEYLLSDSFPANPANPVILSDFSNIGE